MFAFFLSFSFPKYKFVHFLSLFLTRCCVHYLRCTDYLLFAVLQLSTFAVLHWSKFCSVIMIYFCMYIYLLISTYNTKNYMLVCSAIIVWCGIRISTQSLNFTTDLHILQRHQCVRVITYPKHHCQKP